MCELAGAPLAPPTPPAEPRFPEISEEELRGLSWRYCGIVRSGEGLTEVCRRLEVGPLRPNAKPHRALFELRSLHTLAWLIARCALARRESRGAHFRTDYPESRPEFQKHSLIQKDHEVTFF
jgi:aspartate oxidase